MTEQPMLYHDDHVGSTCQHWWEHDYTLEYEPDSKIIHLYEGSDISNSAGDWGEDEAPNCPECGAPILIQFEGDLIEPRVWFNRIDSVST